MKKYIAIASIALTVLLFNACNKWLEEKNYGGATGDMFQSEANIIRLVGQAYADLKWLHDHWGYWGITTLASDEAVCPIRMPGGHWNDNGYWGNFATHNWHGDDASFENLWRKSMSGAVLCNKILQTLEFNKDVISDELYAEYVGELEVLRTYYYYTLFDCFGRIPYTEEFSGTEAVPLSEVSEVWHKLVDCLEKNAPNMKVVNSGNRAELYGRATQGLAYALLARLYLNAASYGVEVPDAYAKCVEACDKIIDAKSYSIEDNFFTNFAIENANSHENIFVIVENGDSKSDSREDNDMMNKLRIVMLTMHYCHQQTWDMIEKPWNGFCAPPELIATYETNDRRGPCPANEGTNATERWGWFVGPVFSKDGTTILKDQNDTVAIIVPEVTSLTSATWNAGARLWKFEVDKVGKNKFCDNDFPLFRYADVLYMRAEAILRGAPGTIDYAGEMAKIRTRAQTEPYTAATLTLSELLDERGREFAWELVRRRDLIRFGKYSDRSWWTSSWRGSVNITVYREWFPLPNPVLARSAVVDGKNIWTQNPGY